MSTLTLPRPALTAQWRNLLYLLSLVPAALVISGNLLGGHYARMNSLFSFVGLVLLERLLPRVRSNDRDAEAHLPDVIMGLQVVAQLLALLSLAYGIASGILVGQFIIFAMVSTGINSGAAAITVGHELCHRKESAWRWASRFLLGSSLNWYFYVAHVRVHHKLVGTQADSTTARRGEWLYFFMLRSVWGQTRDTWRYEAERLRKEGRWPWGPAHYLVGSVLVYAAVLAALYWVHPLAAAAWLGQGVVANLLLEYTNYIQHYGLVRKTSEGIAERVNPTHAWQSNHASRFFLVDLSRHGDHHTYGAKPYHMLDAHEGCPELPTGYSGMIWLAVIPPLFTWVMNRRLDAYLAHTPQPATT